MEEIGRKTVIVKDIETIERIEQIRRILRLKQHSEVVRFLVGYFERNELKIENSEGGN